MECAKIPSTGVNSSRLKIMPLNPDQITAHKALKTAELREMTEISKTRPTTLFIETTSRCNIDCIMCWRQGDNPNAMGDMSLETFHKLLPLLDYAQTVVMQGSGEPFVNPHFPEMLKLAGQRCDGICFATNGTIMPQKYADLLVDCRVNTVMVSMDAGSAPVYEKIRRKSKWSHIMENLERLVETRKKKGSDRPNMTFEFVLMRSNVEDLENFLHTAHRLEVKHVGIRHLWIFDETNREETMFLYPDLMEEWFQRTESLGKELGIHVDLPSRTPIKFAEDYLLERFGDPRLLELAKQARFIPGPGKVCYEPWNNFWVTWQGTVYPCCQSNRVMGNVNDADFMEIWNGLVYRWFRRKLKAHDYPSECSGCRMLRDPLP